MKVQPCILPVSAHQINKYIPLTYCPAAYHTLKDCAEQKKNLSAKIETTNEKIKTKRKQLESLREELKVLGECKILV